MERRPPRSPTGRNAPSNSKGPRSGLESGFRKKSDGNFQTRDGKEGFRSDDKPKRSYGDKPDRAPDRGGYADKPKRSYGDKPDRGPSSDRPARSYGDRPDRGASSDRPQRSYGDRPDRGGNSDRPQRSYGDRPDYNKERSNSDRPQRSYGDRPDRGASSDRPARSYGDRPDRGGYADKPKRSYVDKPAYNNDRGGDSDRPKRSYGDRPDYNKERSNSDRPQRSYGDKPSFDKPKRSFGDRPDRGGYNDKPKRSFGDRPSYNNDRGQDRGGPRGRDEAPEKRSYGPRITVSLYGVHAVLAALVNPERKIKAIYATEDNVSALAPALEEALENGLILPDITIVDKEQFHKALPRDAVHQGVGIDSEEPEEVFIQDIIRKAEVKKKSVVLLLDQVTDPHNIGAILRSACAFGADAIVMQNRNAPDMNGLIAKTASGAIEHVPVIYETNLSRAIETFKEAGFFALALDERGQNIAEAPAYEKTLLVFGAEGPGLRPLVKEKCDLLVKLPTPGPISSLNVSNAAAVTLFAISIKA